MSKKTSKKLWDQKWLYALVALFVSVILWAYVSSVEKVEIEENFTNIHVVFYGEDIIKDSRGLVVTQASDTSVSVRLSGLRSVISRLKERSEEITAVIDVSGVTEPVNNRTTYTLSFPEDIDTSSVSVVSRSPSVIEYYIDKQSTRQIEVIGNFTVKVRDEMLGHFEQMLRLCVRIGDAFDVM